MLAAISKSLFGDPNDREVKKLTSQVAAINALEPELQDLADSDIRTKSEALQARVQGGETADSVLVEAFALVREAAKRTLGQRHFDVQLMGGITLHQGRIAEMKTGEGKTLVATLAVYLNALSGKGVHVVTVNDYLAQRDAGWMAQVYEFLGLTVGCIISNMPDADRRAAYQADVTYGTNNEFGFDYLRDNLKFTLTDMVQRDHHFAIVDEVDSILIDEARTPLVISGPSETSASLYEQANQLVPNLGPEDYELDEKTRSVSLSEAGVLHAETLLTDVGLMEGGSLYDMANVGLLHHVSQALRAHHLFQRDTHYMVKGNDLMIIDEFTGRAMAGRRFSDGLHQALEAKEGLEIQPENQTLASVTYQNYFRLYEKLAGMTGTAMTEAGEFSEIYGLEVTAMPTNQQVQRIDHHDEVYRTSTERDQAIIDLIKECVERRQPILVGTVSIEKSESLAATLKKQKIDHKVLNARFHEEEAGIIALAGVPGAVTIATNMAGRGTDIQLGGNIEMRLGQELESLEGEARDKKQSAIEAEISELKEKALAAGGLCVIGTERHESRRIDNQLRGRSGRQGDPGRSCFFLSLEDDLMRIFGTDRMDTMLQRLGLKDGEAIVHPWINKALERAQQKVEARNFDIRKNILKYDDVMNDQRKVVFEQRIDFMKSDAVDEEITNMRHQIIDELIENHIPPKAYAEQWDIEGLDESVKDIFALDLPLQAWADEEGIADEEITARLYDMSDRFLAGKTVDIGPDLMRQVEKSILLQTLDQHWREHLVTLEHLRQIVGLRGFGQRDPLAEFKLEAFTLFSDLLSGLRRDVVRYLSRVQIETPPPVLETPELAVPQGLGEAGDAVAVDFSKVGRNQPCPCGSGKKFKHCHGAVR